MLETRRETALRTDEGDVVELLEDLPKYGAVKGQRGVVVEAFSGPEPAYDIEVVDREGYPQGMAYSVRPTQVRNVSRETFQHGLELLGKGRYSAAERIFKEASSLNPRHIAELNNSILDSFKGDWRKIRDGMRFVLRLDSNYAMARDNLAVSYMNLGVEEFEKGAFAKAVDSFSKGLITGPAADLVLSLRGNLCATLTRWGMEEAGAAQQHLGRHDYSAAMAQYKGSLQLMIRACQVETNQNTRLNVMRACEGLAEVCWFRADWEKAVQYLEEAQMGGTPSPDALNNYGIALAKLGRLDAAVIALERAVELAPDDEDIKRNFFAIRELTPKSPANKLLDDLVSPKTGPPAFHQPLAPQAAPLKSAA